MILEDKKTVESWITEDPILKEFIQKTRDLYRGPVRFVRSGRRMYQATLDCDKLHGCSGNTKEAFFELNLAKKKNGTYKDFFYLKTISADKSIHTVKLF